MTIQLNNQVTLNNANGTHTHKLCKQVICIETGEVFTSCLDAAEQMGVTQPVMSAHCLGKTRTCKGKHFTYVSHTSENINALTSRIRTLHSAQEELERKAALWDAYEAEQNAIRKAEENRQQAIAKAKEKVARRQRIADRKEEEFKHALSRLHDAERELNALLNEKED